MPAGYEVATQVETICKSDLFARATRGKRLFRYLVESALGHRQRSEMKEVVIGMEVFGKPGNYDPKKDAIVRVSVGQLREKLAEYYETEGRTERVVIRIPLGSYVPDIHYNPAPDALRLSDRAAVHVFNAKAAFDKRTLPGHEAAFKYLERALAEHPGHPRLLALKAMVHAARAMYGRHPRTELEAAEELVEQVKALGVEPWEYCLAHAHVKEALYWDWAGAAALYHRAIELSHGEARYGTWYAAFLVSQGRAEEAVALLTEAVSHFAHDVAVIRGDLSLFQLMARKWDDAEETLRSTLEIFPNGHYLPYLHLAMLHEARGDYPEAVRAIERVPITAPESSITQGVRGCFLGLAGERDRARELYEQLQSARQSASGFVPASQIGAAAIGIGDYDAAVAWLSEAALAERDPVMVWIAYLPFMRHIRHHRGFESLICETMKLKTPATF